MVELQEKLMGIVRTYGCDLSENGAPDAPSRSFTLDMDFSQCTVEDLLDRSASPVRINFQNNTRRKPWEEVAAMPDRITIVVTPVGTKSVKDPEAEAIRAFSRLSKGAQQRVLDECTTKMLDND